MNMYPNLYWVEEVLEIVVPAALSTIPSFLFSIAAYVLMAMALYSLAKRRGIGNAWLSWVPVANVWILGSLSDQYRYVVKGQYKSKRKSLLVLNILAYIFSIALLIACCIMVVGGVSGAMKGLNEDAIFAGIMGPALTMVGLIVPLMAVGIALMILRYMALYDIYTSMDPSNNVLFLVLSILFSVTEPFFLFFNRNKDLGMPQRKQERFCAPEQEPVWQEASDPRQDDYNCEQ